MREGDELRKGGRGMKGKKMEGEGGWKGKRKRRG